MTPWKIYGRISRYSYSNGRKAVTTSKSHPYTLLLRYTQSQDNVRTPPQSGDYTARMPSGMPSRI